MQRHPSQSKIDLPIEHDDDVEGHDDTCQDRAAFLSNAPKNTSLVSLTFCLRCATTKPGEVIRIAGNDKALGKWDVDSGLVLSTTPETYPQWSGVAWVEADSFKPSPSADGMPRVRFVSPLIVEYKYIRDSRKIEGGGLNWENGPNRVISIPLSKDGAKWLVTDLEFEKIVVTAPEREDADVSTFERAYEVVGANPLERGTFGAVWLCYPTGKSETVMLAAKRIDKSKLQSRDVRNLFGCFGREGEVLIHHLLQHPNIVRLFDFFDDRDIVSLVLELCHGGDLFSCIIETRTRCAPACIPGLSEVVVARVVRHILGALAYLHSLQIAHRDMKCENVLLDEKDIDLEKTTYKLCDFGFARRVPLDGALHTMLGSPQTVAPEILTRKPYSFPSDMWSSGVMVYIALSAVEPFQGESLQAVVKKVAAAKYSVAGGVWDRTSEMAKAFLAGLMCVDQNERLTVLAALRHPWVLSLNSDSEMPDAV